MMRKECEPSEQVRESKAFSDSLIVQFSQKLNRFSIYLFPVPSKRQWQHPPHSLDVIFHLFLTSLFLTVCVYVCACVSAGVNLMIATFRTSTTAGWEVITLYLIFATRLSTLIQLRHLTGPLHLRSF